MRQNRVWLTLLIGFVAGCGGTESIQRESVPRVALHEVGGRSLDGIQLLANDDYIEVDFGELTADGRFALVELPDADTAQCLWSIEDSHALTLVVPTERGLELGAVPVEGYSGAHVRAVIRPGTGNPRTVAAAKHKPRILELTCESAGSELVNLRWTQVLPGDYDHNGEVSVTDLVPLASRLGHSYDLSNSQITENPLYWCDGDGNGEVNQADITVIAANYGLAIHGYRVLRNLRSVAGDAMQVAAVDGQKRHWLPSRFSILLKGQPQDSWHVIPDLNDGEFGRPAFTGGGEMTLRIDVSGLLQGDGTYQPPKFSTRVIDPIEDVQSAPALEPLQISEGVYRFENVPRGRVLVLDVLLHPDNEADLKAGSVATDMPLVEQVYSIPFELPIGHSELELNAHLEEAPGATEVLLRTSIRAGAQLPIENEVLVDTYAGTLRRDANYDGQFGGEVVFADADGNGISDAGELLLQVLAPTLPGSRVQLPLHGVVTEADYAAGKLDILTDDGQPRTLLLCEMMGLGLVPDGWRPETGESIEALVFGLPGAPPDMLWVQELRPAGLPELDLKVTTSLDESVRGVQWNPDPQVFSSYRLIRWGHGHPYGWCIDELDISFAATDIPRYFDTDFDSQRAHHYEMYGLTHAGETVYLGSALGGNEDSGPGDSAPFAYFF